MLPRILKPQAPNSNPSPKPLTRCDINNVLHATNPTTAEALVPVLRAVAEEGGAAQ